MGARGRARPALCSRSLGERLQSAPARTELRPRRPGPAPVSRAHCTLQRLQGTSVAEGRRRRDVGDADVSEETLTEGLEVRWRCGVKAWLLAAE